MYSGKLHAFYGEQKCPILTDFDQRRGWLVGFTFGGKRGQGGGELNGGEAGGGAARRRVAVGQREAEERGMADGRLYSME